MLQPLHDPRRYTCPGEPAGISRSIHLARLAASYPKCQSCPHRHETGALRPWLANVPEKSSVQNSAPGRLSRTEHGFRGVYLNQLDRQQAMTWSAALASLLWDDGCVRQIDSNLATLHSSVPTVVIGYDERPAAPDLLIGIARGLERMSCSVIDVGLTTEPCLRFAVRHLQGTAGLYVTGSGCDPAGIGFDLFREFGMPADATFLDRWQAVQSAPLSRPSRSAGRLRAFSAAAAYETELWSRFHALRPLRIVCGATSPQLQTRLERLFSRLPGSLQFNSLPVRGRNLADPNDVDALRIGAQVREHAAHLGIVIDDDATACGFLDERGQLVPAAKLNAMLIEHLLTDQPGGIVVLSTQVWDELAPIVTTHGGKPVLVAEADRAARMIAEDAIAALGVDHRLWFGGCTPVSDAIATLAVVMQALSRSDADFSRVI